MRKLTKGIYNQNAVHFVRFSVVQDIDIFAIPEYANMLIENIKYCQEHKQLQVHAWCLMTSKLYLLVSVLPNNTLSGVIRDLKKYSSVTISEAISKNIKDLRKNWIMWILKSAGEKNTRNEKVQFWQQENQPFEILSAAKFVKCIEYIHSLPFKAGFVADPIFYRYPSAIDYAPNSKKMGLIKITYN